MKIERYLKKQGSKKWELFHKAYFQSEITLSYIKEMAKQEGAYYTILNSKSLTYFKHFQGYNVKVVYSYASKK